MNSTILILTLPLALLTSCTSSGVVYSDPTEIWAHPEYDEFNRGMKDAVAQIQSGKITIPLGGLYDESKLRSVLLTRYGFRTIDGRSGSRAYDTAYNQIMREAAQNKFGAEWWIDALKRAEVPLAPLPNTIGVRNAGASFKSPSSNLEPRTLSR